ncbi:MAG: SDR family NAD(P)-dependent oxidoreductase, partial [Methylovulum sp.]|nr:SDR family NAD(P)-dependent oxidoreductase [Methylovulum sp.]
APELIEPYGELSKYGFDSLRFTELANRLNQFYGLELLPTVFFENPHLQALATYLIKRYAVVLSNKYMPNTANFAIPEHTVDNTRTPVAPAVRRAIDQASTDSHEAIAIIGISGWFPGSATLEEFWQHLLANDDLISEIPKERWNWRDFGGADGKTAIRYGGFINDVDCFDPLFFGISPREAQLLDPQFRLFLETAWAAIEDAGYPASALSGSKTGVFVGVTNRDYQELLQQAENDLHNPALLFNFTMANRVSYLLNLHGPSEPIDTACSSSLVAINRAIESLRQGGCELALVGAANLMLTPTITQIANQAGMLSTDGRCKAFDQEGDGYGRGEGVGVLLLKPLSKAISDGDRVYALIRGNAENHGGKAASPTAPNPLAQQDLLLAAYGRAGIAADTIGYIEAHGTGTPLGDPIEMQGLTGAFAELYRQQGLSPAQSPHCGIGSVKTNIGHLEAAAGIAGVIKIILMMKHRKIPGNRHLHTPNPYLQLAGSPFYLVKDSQDWLALETVDGKLLPRRAGISGFGIGGSNAHIILEEYLRPPVTVHTISKPPYLIVLSAKKPERLKALVDNLLNYLDSQGLTDRDLPDLAYTLQVGRMAMAQRLAISVNSLAELKEGLYRYGQEGERTEGFYSGQVRRNQPIMSALFADDDMAVLVETWISKRKYEKLLELWVQGLDIDWHKVYPVHKPQRIGLPTYPFAKESYWVSGPLHKPAQPTPEPVHPLLHKNNPSLEQQHFSTVLTGQEFFLADHQVHGQRLLPGVAYLEMARAAFAAAEEVGQPSAIRLQNVLWLRPLAVGATPQELHIAWPINGLPRSHYEIYTVNGGEQLIHCRGIASRAPAAAPPRVDIAQLQTEIGQWHSNAEQCYRLFNAIGLAYGPAHQAIEGLAMGERQVLAKLRLPASVLVTQPQFVLHPSLMDAALQATVGLLPEAVAALRTNSVPASLQAAVPFALEELVIFAACPPTLWAWLRYSDGETTVVGNSKLAIDLCAENGEVCVQLRGFSARAMDTQTSPIRHDTLLYQPVWQDAPAGAADVVYTQHWLMAYALPQCPIQQILAQFPHLVWQPLEGSVAALAECYTALSLQILQTVQQILVSKPDKVMIQLLLPDTAELVGLAGLAGLLKTVHLEHPQIIGQVLTVSAHASPDSLLGIIRENINHPEHSEVRYLNGLRQIKTWAKLNFTPATNPLPWRERGVYWLMGGAGGLGLLIAKDIASKVSQVTLVLTGRSELTASQRQQLAELEALGAQVTYAQVDLADGAAVEAWAEAMAAKAKPNGIIHCAGIIKDRYLAKKSATEFAQVLAAKVAGTVHLDQATRHLRLDFFVLFSSVAGSLGNAGQSDYAAANAFMDAYAHTRQQRVAEGLCYGQTLSVNWPLWQFGGMQVDGEVLKQLYGKTGMVAVPTAIGIEVLYQGLALQVPQLLVLYGAATQLQQHLFPAKIVTAVASPANLLPKRGLSEHIGQALMGAISEILQVKPEDLDNSTEFSEYGFDSLTLTEFANRLNRRYALELMPTVFFEYPTIASFADYLAEWQAAAFSVEFQEQAISQSVDGSLIPPLDAEKTVTEKSEKTVAAPALSPSGASEADRTPSPPPVDAIAVIGISGRFPMADDVEAFWQNLLAGKDCISEIPSERWDWRALYGDPHQESGKTNIKWGGFINGVAEFDSLFFGIAPREALQMDPQQRLLMQYVWLAIEDAGYSADTLAGSLAGIFVGTTHSGYGKNVGDGEAVADAYGSTGSVPSLGPNRMSYFLDIHGPSEPIETSCSSSLVAIHKAMQALLAGDCDLAIAGGINTIVTPDLHISFNRAGMLCADGRCKTFAQHADGYVRGEGVGMLVLKKLAVAQQDGDPIYGVLRASAINHGGRANSLTAPNPKAQAAVVKTAYRKAGIDPRTVTYIEAHGTGTELGDPVEINGLKAAFAELYQDVAAPQATTAHCGVGTVKTHIGHLELAAGVVGVIKVLLQLKHKTLIKNLHCTTVNPYVQLADSPFYLVQETQAWQALRDDDGHWLPRRAGVSSFGFGGVNAHLVLEEYGPPSVPTTAVQDKPVVIVLSAQNPERLLAYADKLLAFVRGGQGHTTPTAQQLAETIRILLADILQVSVADIDADQDFESYGLDYGQRLQLLERLRQESTLAVDTQSCLRQNSIAALVTAILPSGGLSVSLPDMAYTLQIGRKAMAERLAVVASSLSELEQKLAGVVAGQTEIKAVYRGHVKRRPEAVTAEDATRLEQGLALGEYATVAELWVKGLAVDWHRLYCYAPRRRINLPTYPFAKERYWLERQAATVAKSLHSPAIPAAIGGDKSVSPLEKPKAIVLRSLQDYTAVPVAQVSVLKSDDVLLRLKSAMPEQITGLIPTLNRTGYMLETLLSYSKAFADFSGKAQGEVLDIGCAYGIASIAALEQGAKVLAVDMEVQHLDILLQRLSETARGRIATQTGMLPDIDFADNRFNAIHACRVLHFLPPEAIRLTLQKMYRWLQPGGKLFVVTDSPYVGYWRVTAEVYAARKQSGDVWPGFIADVPALLNTPQAQQGPRCVNPLDPDILSRECLAAGFLVEQCGFEGSDIFPECKGTALAGLEHAGIIAVKPLLQERSEPLPSVTMSSANAQLLATLRQSLAEELQIPLAQLEDDMQFKDLGLNSISGVLWVTRINTLLGLKLRATEIYSYPTLEEFAVQVGKQLVKPENLARPQPVISEAKAIPPLGQQAPPVPPPLGQSASAANDTAPPKPDQPTSAIAIIGMAGQFPKAKTLAEFWDNLVQGRDCIEEVPPERWRIADYYQPAPAMPGKTDCKWMGALADIDQFDPFFFNISPREAELMDPQQRLFLQACWHCIEDAAYAPARLSGSKCGVFVGCANNNYENLSQDKTLGVQMLTGGATSFLAARISYVLNLQGPSMAIDTACSSSLVAIAHACDSLRSGGSDLALAGGVSVIVDPTFYVMGTAAGVFSPTGHCYSFDQRADGFVPSEGVGVVMLKRLEDAEKDGDAIYGVIRGWGVNHDGKSNGMTAPNAKSQARLEQDIYQRYGINPETIQMLEAHGTGTQLGDPIEIEALTASFRHFTEKRRYCALGSVKSNIGHPLLAAGVA